MPPAGRPNAKTPADPAQRLLAPVRAALKVAAALKPKTAASQKLFDAAVAAAGPLGEARHLEGVRELLALVGDRPDAPAPWRAARARLLFELGDDAAFRDHVAEHYSGDEAALKGFAGWAADRAVEEGASGRGRLPEAWRGDFDAVLAAFRAYEKGDDAAAREFLKGVAASSPFAEWRLFLRGVTALANGEPARAEETFARLDPARLPAKFAAPLRPAAPPDERLARQRRELETPTMRAVLGAGAALDRAPGGGRNGIGKPLEKAKAAADLLEKIDPALAARMRRWAYRSVIEAGDPADVGRYGELFGAPADDPKLDRLRAEVARALAGPISAAPQWKSYAAYVASAKSHLPEALRKPAEAAVLRAALGEALASIREKQNDPYAAVLMQIGRFAAPTVELADALASAAPDRPDCLAMAFRGWQLAGDPAAKWPKFDDALARFPGHPELVGSLIDFATRFKDFSRRSKVLLARAEHAPLDREARRQAAAGVLAELRPMRDPGDARRGELVRYLAGTAAPYPDLARVHAALQRLDGGDKAALEALSPMTPGLAYLTATEYKPTAIRGSRRKRGACRRTRRCWPTSASWAGSRRCGRRTCSTSAWRTPRRPRRWRCIGGRSSRRFRRSPPPCRPRAGPT
jgi:hypothetical protein